MLSYEVKLSPLVQRGGRGKGEQNCRREER